MTIHVARRRASAQHRPSGIRWKAVLFLALALMVGGGIMVVPMANASSCTNLVADSGLESGAGWTTQTNGSYAIISNYATHAGVQAAYLAGADNAQDQLSTKLNVPANQEVSLSFWWLVESEEESGDYDGLSVIVADAAGAPLKTLLTLGNNDAQDYWQWSRLDMSEFGGQTVQLQFVAQADSTLSTDFLVDDVEVNACAAGQSNWLYIPFFTRQ
ncbi:MAG: hypothetical protein KDE47_02120 [Caldilineaceae bacterium]|nr:hypothetical protein [Caldilineaceae bacterium]